MRWSAKATVASIGVWLAGCGGESQPPVPIAMGQIPAAVVKAAREAMKDVQFVSATRAKARGVDVYAIQGKDPKGRPRSIEVRQDGTIVPPQ